MSKDPAFLFYVNDYLGDTMNFSLEQHGAYLKLMLFEFNSGAFTYDSAVMQINSEESWLAETYIKLESRIRGRIA